MYHNSTPLSWKLIDVRSCTYLFRKGIVIWMRKNTTLETHTHYYPNCTESRQCRNPCHLKWTSISPQIPVNPLPPPFHPHPSSPSPYACCLITATQRNSYLKTTVCSMAPRHCTIFVVIITSTLSSRWRFGSCKDTLALDDCIERLCVRTHYCTLCTYKTLTDTYHTHYIFRQHTHSDATLCFAWPCLPVGCFTSKQHAKCTPGDRLAWTILYRGFPTRMVYLKHDI